MSKKSASYQQVRQKNPRVARGQTDARRLRRLVCHLQTRREADFRRIVAVLHDDILSPLAGVMMDLGNTSHPWQAQDIELSKVNPAVVRRIQTVIKAAAELQAGLIPPLLKHCGLEAVLSTSVREWADSHSGGCRFISHGSERDIAPPLALAMFRIFRDALISVNELPSDIPLDVELACLRRSWRLRIRVWTNRSEAATALRRSMALQAARERARCLGGSLSVRKSASFVALSFGIPEAA